MINIWNKSVNQLTAFIAKLLNGLTVVAMNQKQINEINQKSY